MIPEELFKKKIRYKSTVDAPWARGDAVSARAAGPGSQDREDETIHADDEAPFKLSRRP